MKKILFIICCLALSFTPVFAQQNEEPAGESLENEVEEALNEAVNKIENLFKKKSKKKRAEENEEEEVEAPVYEERIEEESSETTQEEQEAEEAAAEILSNIFGADADEDYVPTTNEFIGQFTMQMEMFKNDKPDKHNPMVMDFHFSKTKTGMLMKSNDGMQGRMIMDLTDNTMTMITTDGKGDNQAFKMRKPNTKKAVEEIYEGYQVTQTEEYKTIDGYRCRKVIIDDTKEDTKTIAWLTKDIDVDWKKVVETLMAGRVDAQFDNLRDLEGFTIESETISKNGKERHTVKMSNIKVGAYDQSVFDTSGVEIMTLPGIGG